MNKVSGKIRREDGFTLTEVMIGMTILTVAIVAATSLVLGLMKSNSNNVKTLQAYYLAQEGVEMVRNVRDTNWLNNKDWLNNLVDEAGSADSINRVVGISFLNTEENLTPEQFVSVYPWNFDSSSFEYVNDEDVIDATEFNRSIEISDHEQECEGEVEGTCDYKLVTVTVDWKDGAKDRNFTLQTILTNWKDGVF
ncbi:prepilin-type N-terminal cleavage/methylation domain-containing protein [Candidatus Peregrinibacteria bacterium]|jgi:prepilin-type N-terminal cleavage/methylation domain-containing protein|nr:prepilin-type N-terminal cleavage/methylation domain-containing protein [Candidatus Peregrinibacteria bacterium]